MDNNIDNEMEDFEEQFANNIKYNLEDNNIPRKRSFPDFISRRKTLILIGVGVFFLIVLIALFFGGSNNLSEKYLTSLKTRVDLLEKILTRFEGMELRVASLEKKENKLEQSIAEVNRSKKLLTQQYNKLNQRLEMLQKGKAPVPEKIKGPIAIEKKPLSLSKKRFHEVRTGDTLFRIAIKYGISVEKLRRLNNIDKNKIIRPGQKLVVSPGSQN